MRSMLDLSTNPPPVLTIRPLKPYFVGQAQLRDGLEALQALLLVDDQVDVAVLDALHRRRERSKPAA